MWGLCILLVLAFVHSSSQADLNLTTNVGQILGLTSDDGNYTMYLGIPYGDVNASNPFGAATAHAVFDDVFEAYDESAICPQKQTSSSSIGTLDCLQLSVFVPNAANSSNTVPVIIWIYGGSFRTGSFGNATYGPKFLVNHGVIVVKMNYRLGPYGFMCLDTAEVPGNQGLKDQYLAIQWVYNNIAAFGGDITKITLMGQSAGSKSVELQLLTQRERLFQQVIMQSGSTLGPGVVELSNTSAPIILAQQLGYDPANMSQALEYLISSEPQAVVNASLNSSTLFQICVEKEFDGVERFVFEHPELSNYTNASSIPILAGFTDNELLTQYNNDDDYFNADIFSEKLKLLFNISNNTEMEEYTRHFYLGDEVANATVKLEIIDFLSDYTYDYPVQRTLARYNASGNSNIYQYLFSYIGGRNIPRNRLKLTVGGACHADDIGYLFDAISLQSNQTTEDLALVETMTTLWTNFVKYGNPTPSSSDVISETWTPISDDAFPYLSIGTNITMKSRPLPKRLAFWDLFFTAYNSTYKVNLGYFD